MATVGSLWVGGPLGFVQRLCLKSFVHYGHSIRLYVYDMDMDVPEGVEKRDASEIVPENKVFSYHGQLAAFSDYFRYKMIEKENIMWVDADTLCLTENFFEDVPFVFIKESDHLIAGGILKMDNTHKITKQINEQADYLLPKLKAKQKDLRWAMLGPLLLTKMVRRHKLSDYAQPAKLVNVLDHWSKGSDFWDPTKTDEIIRDCSDAYSATMFTGNLRATGFDTEQTPPTGSAIEYFSRKFGA
jgi:hypothetical protein